MRNPRLQNRPLFGDEGVLSGFGYATESKDEEPDELLDVDSEYPDDDVAPSSPTSNTSTQEREPLSNKRNAAETASHILKRAKPQT